MAAPASAIEPLPELAGVYWRTRADDRRLRSAERVWCGWTLAHVVPFVAVAIVLLALSPLSAPVALMALAQAWFIPKLYAQRGANVLRPRGRAGAQAELRALGLLGDLTGHEQRALLASSGVVVEPGAFGTWLLGEAGALLVRPPRARRRWRLPLVRPRRRVHCFCVRAKELDELPAADRIAHLLLALRADEPGFATLANREFVGSSRRLRRRLAPKVRPAFDAAVTAAPASTPES